MNVWWISLLSFLAGFAICMAIAGWLVVWHLWNRPPLHDSRLKLALYDPELHDLDDPGKPCRTTTSSLPSLEEDRTVHSGIATLPREAIPAEQYLVRHVFEENIALRESLNPPSNRSSG